MLQRRRLSRRVPALAALLLLAPDQLLAQVMPERVGSVILPWAEPSRFLRNVPNDETNELFEALVAIHFARPLPVPIVPDRNEVELPPSHWAWAPSFSMLINLRQLSEDSAPVRSPSYNPRVRSTIAYTFTQQIGRTPRSTQLLFDIAIGHYSNGQDNCLFEQMVELNDEEKCYLPPTVDVASLSIANGGSFSSHYVEGTVGVRHFSWSDVIYANDELPSTNMIGAFAKVRSYQPLSVLPGGMETALLEVYGATRFRLGLEGTTEQMSWGASGPLWVVSWWEFTSSRLASTRRPRFSLEVGKAFNRAYGAGVFARLYSGHDDYNANFVNHLRAIQAGLTIGGERRARARVQ